MRPLLRFALRAFLALLLLIAVPIAVAGVLLFRTLPPGSGTGRLPGLSAPVQVTFDRHDIPWIKAKTREDAAEALGYIHARDRMFQMELMRRNASGRLSEIAGPATLPIDKLSRVMGLRRRAEQDLAALPPETRAMLAAYARGVNAWIAQRGRLAAPEFVVLGAPEPWTETDSLLWGETMAEWLSYNWRTELSRLALAGRLPPERINELWPPLAGDGGKAAALDARARTGDARHAGLTDLGLKNGGLKDGGLARAVLAALPRFPDPFTLPEAASNEWAVDGSRTATGAPLLAGDPHLALAFPGIWYLARIDTPQGTLAGATAPGVPFLILGHNSRIAWTFTTTGADTQDLFEEKVLPDGTYVTPDGPRPFTVREERIKVRGQKDVVLRVRETRHGPVISDLIPGRAPPGTVLAAAMANLAPGNMAPSGILALDRAGSVAEAGQAAAGITSPVQNLLVADRKGIALFTTGRVPVRRGGDGAAPVPGADGADDWTGYAGSDRLPRIVAPPSGQLVNGNERVPPPDFPVYLGRDWFGDWRARRIRQMLGSRHGLTAADFARMQVDDTDTFAQQVLPALLRAAPQGGTLGGDTLAARAAALLRGWDGTTPTDRPQPLIFNAWVQRFYLLLLQRAGIAGVWTGPWEEFTAWLLTQADPSQAAAWCGGDCTGPLRTALEQASAALAARFGQDPSAWRWGAVHQAVFGHPILEQIPGLSWLTTMRIPVPGDDTTVFRGGSAVGMLDSRHGPGYRGVYDLSDLDRSLYMIVPGQSGNLASGHARDLLRPWRDGATITLGPRPDGTEAELELTP